MSLQHAALNSGGVGQAIPMSNSSGSSSMPPPLHNNTAHHFEGFENTGFQRGELRGDNCLTMDLCAAIRFSQKEKRGDNDIRMAIFNESKTRSSLVGESVGCGVRAESKSIDMLNIIDKNAYVQMADLDGITVVTTEKGHKKKTIESQIKLKSQKADNDGNDGNSSDDSQVLYPFANLDSQTLKLRSLDEGDTPEEQPEVFTSLLLSPILRKCVETAEDDEEYVTGKINKRKVKPTRYVTPLSFSWLIYYHNDDVDADADDEYTNLCNLCLLLFRFIYMPHLPSPSPAPAFLTLFATP
jgi:hypothetical protein